MAILSDAVALVRGDRFYTVDYTPKSLTNWGFNEVNYDNAINGGHVMHKLIFRAFPNHFVYNSIYAHFPLVNPSENAKIFEGLGTRSQYSWEKPRAQQFPVMIRSHKACTQILNDNRSFKVVWGEAVSSLVNNVRFPGLGADFCLSGDRNANLSNRRCIQKCLYPNN
jgi:linoleate 8R-lipoxygenase / 9,12-octadecadienoate 8-hydroperoxide 8R-isomerase